MFHNLVRTILTVAPGEAGVDNATRNPGKQRKKPALRLRENGKGIHSMGWRISGAPERLTSKSLGRIAGPAPCRTPGPNRELADGRLARSAYGADLRNGYPR